MYSPLPESTKPYGTRSSNASMHPGLPDQKRKKRSTVEVAAEREAKALDDKNREAERSAVLARIAELETQTNTATGSQLIPLPNSAELVPAVAGKSLQRTGTAATTSRTGTLRLEVNMLRDDLAAQSPIPVSEPSQKTVAKRKALTSR